MTETQVFGGDDFEKRPLIRSMWRGWRGKCPACGEGRLFSSWLKTVDDCEVCGEHIAHHRADDLPPYLNIFIVGHVVVAALIVVMARTDWSAWTHMAVWGTVTIVMTLLLMQPLKGLVVGLQWANRMHGFSGNHEDDDDPTAAPAQDYG
ncbi:MAG: DUF983 domain-containing protein [Pseudomonadota bacterium]